VKRNKIFKVSKMQTGTRKQCARPCGNTISRYASTINKEAKTAK
jgi:hypothetical protein